MITIVGQIIEKNRANHETISYQVQRSSFAPVSFHRCIRGGHGEFLLRLIIFKVGKVEEEN